MDVASPGAFRVRFPAQIRGCRHGRRNAPHLGPPQAPKNTPTTVSHPPTDPRPPDPGAAQAGKNTRNVPETAPVHPGTPAVRGGLAAWPAFVRAPLRLFVFFSLFFSFVSFFGSRGAAAAPPSRFPTTTTRRDYGTRNAEKGSSGGGGLDCSFLGGAGGVFPTCRREHPVSLTTFASFPLTVVRSRKSLHFQSLPNLSLFLSPYL